jgi:hypothetical protein
VLAALGLLLLGGVVGLSATWTHGRWWALALGAAATLTAELATPPGLLRVGYAGGWLVPAAYFLLARPEGDFIVGSSPLGYTFVGLGLVVMVLGLATIPARHRLRGGAGRSA